MDIAVLGPLYEQAAAEALSGRHDWMSVFKDLKTVSELVSSGMLKPDFHIIGSADYKALVEFLGRHGVFAVHHSKVFEIKVGMLNRALAAQHATSPRNHPHWPPDS